MQVIAKRTLRAFWDIHPQARTPLDNWHKLVSRVTWSVPQDVKTTFGRAVDFVGDNRAIFDVGGNKYRIVAHIAYRYGKVLIKFVGTHKEYDNIDAETV